jgi:hypothetical protein
MECLTPGQPKLAEIGLALLKYVSSHKGLTPDIFDEFTRRQYVAKAPQRNPFGEAEEPLRFHDFDVFTKINVLQQLTQWVFYHPERVREKMEEQKDSEQTFWRIEPFGWDSEDRTYIVLDDNRVYRQTDAPPPPPPPAKKAMPKKNSKAYRAMQRAKRRKLSEGAESEHEEDEQEEHKEEVVEDDGLGGAKWECLAVTLDDLNRTIESFAKSRDPNEKTLRKRLSEELLPLLEKAEESRKKKQAQKERELLNMEKLAHAKRSSRIASKMEHQKQEEEARAAERKRQEELAMAKKEQEKWRKLEKERESRMQTREQRLREREAKRILHEEELANLSENSKRADSDSLEGRLSERHLKAEIERKRKALEELQEDEDWTFDCICGVHGKVDDGTLSIACEKCNVWQHAKCNHVSEADAQRDDYHFVCNVCKKKEQEEEEAKNRPHITIKFNRPHSSSSPPPAAPSPAILPPLKQDRAGSIPSVEGLQLPWLPMQPRLVHSSPTRSPIKSPAILPPIPYTNGANELPPPTDLPRPHSQGSTPAAPQFANRMNGTTPARLNLSGSFGNPFSSPAPNSPTSLPPPIPPPHYTTLNSSFGSTSQPQPIIHSTPATALPRRPSVSFPSPLNGAPVLQPSPAQFAAAAATPQQLPRPVPAFSTPAHQQTPSYVDGALPPSSAGISPVKHSPPLRPTTANGQNGLAASFNTSFNGSFGEGVRGTPTTIPPIAPLSPSPRPQDLTPPVKKMDYGQPLYSPDVTSPVQERKVEGAVSGDAGTH